jgi:hypothetical protein
MAAASCPGPARHARFRERVPAAAREAALGEAGETLCGDSRSHPRCADGLYRKRCSRRYSRR